MIISSPMASDRAEVIPSVSPPRTRFGSAIAGDAEREEGELPAVMIDPLRHEHAVGRAREQDRQKGERISARIDQPPRGQREREQQQQIRQQRRDRDRPSFGCRRRRGTAEGARISPAIGRSTSRDQWMFAPKGGFIRYWRRSYQPCP